MTTDTKIETPVPVGTGDLLGQRWSIGKIFRCYSERFGTHDLLCVKCPGETREDRIRFMEVMPNGESRELLYFSSAENDRVEKEWKNLLAYYAEVLA